MDLLVLLLTIVNGDIPCNSHWCSSDWVSYKQINDGVCDLLCQTLACRYDGSDTEFDCHSECGEQGCDMNLLFNDRCDESCNYIECGFDLGRCGYCASGCFESDLFNDSLDDPCNTIHCYYDSSLFQECSPGCTFRMLTNEDCDPLCNTSLCNFDYGNCNSDTECTPGCLLDWLGNGICNEECNTQECSFDDYDCLCAIECTEELLSNNVCDFSCNNEDCEYDKGYCTCPFKCEDSSGDGECDLECWNESCLWIDSDCGCAPNCKFEEIQDCKAECLVIECSFGSFSGYGQCYESSKTELAKLYQIIKGNFSVSSSFENCFDSSRARFPDYEQGCTQTMLENDPCFTDENSDMICYIEECAYGLGKCSDCESSCGINSLCYLTSSSEVYCLSCADKFLYFGHCVDNCPFGYTADSANVCISNRDDSSELNPTVYYVSNYDNQAIDYGDGSVSNPFTLLSVALARIYSKFTVLQLTAGLSYTLEKVPSDYSISKLADYSQPLIRTGFSPERIIIEGGVNTELAINDENFMVFDITYGTLELRSLTIRTYNLTSTCEGDRCNFCPLVDCTSNCIDQPDCSNFTSINFFRLYSQTTKLVLNNVSFFEMQNNFNSLVYIEGGDLEMNEVEFSKIKTTNAVIVSTENTGNIHYNSGTVKKLNDNYELMNDNENYTGLKGFMAISEINKIYIYNVLFLLNVVYNEPLIKIRNTNKLTVDFCEFRNSILLRGIFKIEDTKETYSLLADSNHTIAEHSRTHLEIANSNFQTIYITDHGVFEIKYSIIMKNIHMKNCTFSGLINENSPIIEIKNDLETPIKEGYYKTYINSRMVLGYFYENSLKLEDIIVKKSWLGSDAVLYAEHMGNVMIDHLEISDIKNKEIYLYHHIGNIIEQETDSYINNYYSTSIQVLTSLLKVTDSYSLSIQNSEIQNIQIDQANLILDQIETLRIDGLHIRDINCHHEEGFVNMNIIETGNLSNSIFSNIENTNSNGYGVLKLLETSSSQFFIDSSVFENNTSQLAVIYSEVSALTIGNSTFQGNFGTDTMGVLYTYMPIQNLTYSLNLMDDNFIENSAFIGTCIYIEGKYLDTNILMNITDCSFQRNNGISGVALYVGIRVIIAQNSIVKDCSFTANEIVEGDISILGGGYLLVDSCVFTGNTASTASVLALYPVISIDFHMVNSTIRNNTSNYLIVIANDQLTTKNCLIEANSGSSAKVSNGKWTDLESTIQSNTNEHSAGSGIFVMEHSELHFEKTQIIGNSAEYGGGVYLSMSSSLDCNQCFFSQNTATISGGGIFSEHSHLFIRESIFTENEAIADGGSAIKLSSNLNTEISDTEFSFNYAEFSFTIELVSTVITMERIELHDNFSPKNPGVDVSTGTLNLYSSRIYNQQSVFGPGIFCSMCSLNIQNSEFFNLTAEEKGGAIYLMMAINADIANSMLYQLSARDGGALSASANSQVNLYNTEIFDVTVTDRGVLSLEDSEIHIYNSTIRDFNGIAVSCYICIHFHIENSEIYNEVLTRARGGLELTETYTANVISSSFRNIISSRNGGGLYLASQSLATYTITNNTFKDIVSLYGGAIYNENSLTWIHGNTFENNIAFYERKSSVSGNGGAIMLFCSLGLNCKFYVEDNLFLNNQAQVKGGGIYWEGSIPMLTSNSFKNNTATYGNEIASYPVKINIVDSNKKPVPNIQHTVASSDISVSPGQTMADYFYLALVDHYDSIVTTDNNSLGTLKSDDSSLRLSGKTVFLSENGLFNITDFIISAPPTSQVTISLITGAIDSSMVGYVNETVSINIRMKECILGEILSRNECLLCSENTYSFNTNDTECFKCPSNTICYGGANVVPEKGYWRSSLTSGTSWECPNFAACVGSEDISSQGECAKGYYGNMCHSCMKGYSRTAKDVCKKCPDDKENAFITGGILIGLITLSSFMVKSALNSAHKPKAMLSVYMKIMINYLQLAMMTAAFDLDWPSYVKELFAAQEQAGSSGDQLFSFDCYLEEPFFFSLIVMSLLPVMISIISFLFWIFVSYWKSRLQYIKEELISTIIVLLFMVHPQIIRIMFRCINCIEIEDGEYWLVYDLEIPCWDKQHSLYVFAIVVPSIILWGLLVPGLLTLALYKNRKRLHTLSVRKMYGFLFNGYSKREYYWETVILYRKIGILCCATIIGSISIPIQALCVMLVILACLYLQKKYTPYTNESLNHLELQSIFISGITIYCGLFYLTGDLDDLTKILLFFIILGANLYFLFVWVKGLCNVGVRAIASKIPFLRNVFLKETRDGFDSSVFKLEEKIDHVYGEGVDKMYTLVTQNSAKKIQLNVSSMRELYLYTIWEELLDQTPRSCYSV